MALALRNAGRAGLARLRGLQELVQTVDFSSGVSSQKVKVEQHETYQKVKKQHKDTMKDHTGWDERQASASEAAVKADKEEFHPDTAASVEEMQAHSVKVLKETGGDVSEDHEEARKTPEPRRAG